MKRIPLHLFIALFQIAAALFGLGLVPGARAFGSESGSLYLDLGGRSAFWDTDHRLGLGAGLGLALSAGESAELEARLGYAVIPARVDGAAPTAAHPAAGDVELGSGEVAAYYAPYRGLFRPMVGAHLGLARVNEAWHWNLGMDAMALFCVSERIQLYGNAIPSLLLLDGTGEAWLRVGAGVRVRLGR